MSTVATTKCPHCNGPVELLGKGRGGTTIQRCRACGREPSEIVRQPANGASANGGGKRGPCPVDGCPGTLDDSGRCACCARRAAYLEQNMPKRKCAICDGPITGHGGRKLCKPCKAVASRVNVAKAPSQRSKAA